MDRDILWLPLLLMVVASAHAFWRHHQARTIAEEWLMRQRYRVRSLRTSWIALHRFSPRLFRNHDRAHEFRAEVDDLRLGGTGVMYLRVWTDWAGLVEREPEVSWDRMPTVADERSRSVEDRWFERQLELLSRVAKGETTFREESAEPGDDASSDEVVEHLLALAKRGLVVTDAPLLSGRGARQRRVVTGVRVTDAGWHYLGERAREGGEPPLRR